MKPVTLRINSKIVDLYGEESLGLDFASFDVDEVTKRKGALSINFQVPPTANNCLILGNAQEINSRDTKPYNIFEARLYVDGIDIAITKCELISASRDGFELRLFNEDSGVFLALKERTIGELDLQALDHMQNGGNVYGRIAAPAFIVYPLLHSNEGAFPNPAGRTMITYMGLPCLYMDSLISLMFLSLGYGVIDTITDAKIALPPSDTFKRNKDKRRYLGTARCTQPFNLDFGNVNKLTFDTFESNTGYPFEFFEGLFDPILPPFSQAGEIGSWIRVADEIKNFKATFTASVTNPNSSSSSLEVEWSLYDSGNTLIENNLGSRIFTIPAGQTVTISYTLNTSSLFTANVEDSLRLNFVWVGGASSTVNSAELTIDDLTVETGGEVQRYEAVKTSSPLQRLNYPTRWVTANSIPKQNWKWGDLIREYLKLTSGVITFDHIAKKVYLTKMSALEDNIGTAYNWTNKVDYFTEPVIEFANDQYAQRNNFTYKPPFTDQHEDENGDPYPLFTALDGTDFTQQIANTNLKAEEDLIDSEFSFSRQIIRFDGLNVAHVPQYRYVETAANVLDAPLGFQRNSVGQPIVLLREMTDAGSPLTVQMEDDLYSPSTHVVNTWYVSHFIDSTQPISLGWGTNLVEEFYDYLIGIVTNYKKVTLRLNLNPVDIRTLDFQRPVYISGVYYYINAVNGYDPINGGSTEVELIKLNPYG
jgi:hypothetical protein